MLNFNSRKTGNDWSDIARYRQLALHMVLDYVGHFGQYLDADVPCQKLTEGLEALYFALAFRFLMDNHALKSFSRELYTMAGKKRALLFEVIWPGVMIIVNAVLKSFAVPGCKECGLPSGLKQCLCLDRIVVLWRIVYL